MNCKNKKCVIYVDYKNDRDFQQIVISEIVNLWQEGGFDHPPGDDTIFEAIEILKNEYSRLMMIINIL